MRKNVYFFLRTSRPETLLTVDFLGDFFVIVLCKNLNLKGNFQNFSDMSSKHFRLDQYLCKTNYLTPIPVFVCVGVRLVEFMNIIAMILHVPEYTNQVNHSLNGVIESEYTGNIYYHLRTYQIQAASCSRERDGCQGPDQRRYFSVRVSVDVDVICGYGVYCNMFVASDGQRLS